MQREGVPPCSGRHAVPSNSPLPLTVKGLWLLLESCVAEGLLEGHALHEEAVPQATTDDLHTAHHSTAWHTAADATSSRQHAAVQLTAMGNTARTDAAARTQKTLPPKPHANPAKPRGRLQDSPVLSHLLHANHLEVQC